MNSEVKRIYRTLFINNGMIHGYTKVGEYVDIELEYNDTNIYFGSFPFNIGPPRIVTTPIKFTVRL